jgi:hypothetical protein
MTWLTTALHFTHFIVNAASSIMLNDRRYETPKVLDNSAKDIIEKKVHR